MTKAPFGAIVNESNRTSLYPHLGGNHFWRDHCPASAASDLYSDTANIFHNDGFVNIS